MSWLFPRHPSLKRPPKEMNLLELRTTRHSTIQPELDDVMERISIESKK